jgi:hypothetical protein
MANPSVDGLPRPALSESGAGARERAAAPIRRARDRHRAHATGAAPGEALALLDDAGECFVGLFAKGWISLGLLAAAGIILAICRPAPGRDR